MNKAVLKAGLIALAAYVVVAAVQRNVFVVPVIGDYLPK